MALSSKRQKGPILPTPAELRILQVLWELGQGTVDNVLRQLPQSPPPNYKTVQTILRIMEHKRFVRHAARGRVFVFEPRVSREEVGRCSVDNLLQQNFGGSPSELMMNMLEGNQIDESELNELESLIRKYRTNRRAESSSSK
jgi:BlaI family penicillinase repressor